MVPTVMNHISLTDAQVTILGTEREKDSFENYTVQCNLSTHLSTISLVTYVIFLVH